MKNKGLIITPALALIIAAAAIQILPDLIPAHFGMSGDADRFGSKYEVLFFAAIVVITSVIGILLRRKFDKDANNARDEKTASHGAGNAKICGIVCTAMNAVMIGLECIFIALGYNGVQHITGTDGELYCSATVILIGILFAVLGNIMPKMKMNGLMGLRTSWSMKNDEVWSRCQRMGGTVTFFGGIAIILSGIILRGYPALVAMVIIFTVIFAVMIKGSHQIYTDWEKEQNNG